ncbi:MAG: hypothetical protein IKY78_05460 [Clostridia bacterium]|nr:hypothetical protein [Clostridia bacterium]
MTDKEILLSRIHDKKAEADKNVMITHSAFLSVDEINDSGFINIKNYNGVKAFHFGGFSEAERQVIFFVPECFGISDISEYFSECKDDNPIAAVKVIKDRFSSLSHRDYLGAIMGLGIKRELVGDIITCDFGAYIICFKSIASFIVENLTRGGRGTLNCSVVDIENVELPTEKTEIRFHSVASLRLDNIMSSGFNIPRSVCGEYVNKGVVFINSVRVLKVDAPVREHDKLVVRGKGKIVLEKVIGENKKGRVHINIKHYL